MRSEASRVWRVGELAAATGLTVRTFHHYNHIGLLIPSRRSAGGHRLYTVDDLRRLSLIVILRRAGLPLAEIKHRLDSGSIDVPALIERQTSDLESALADAVALRRRLADVALGDLIREPSQVRELASWVPHSTITAQPILLLVYADVERAHRKLVEMFGFGPGEIARQPDGSTGYAEVTGPTGNIRLHAPRPGLRPPDPAAEPSAMTVVGVANVDAHLERAVAAGAQVVRPIATVFGMREYLALDHEHHLWCFQQPG